MSRIYLAAILLALTACAGAPVIVSAHLAPDAAVPGAIARTNLRQTLVVAHVEFTGEIMTADGFPVAVHHVEKGVQLYIDRDADVRIEVPIGTPLPASAAALFPRPGEAEALGLVFSEPE